MKIEPRQLSILLVITYLSIAVPLVYSIFTFPADISASLPKEITSLPEETSQKIEALGIYIVVELSIGLFGMVFLTRQILHRNQRLREDIDTINKDLLQDEQFTAPTPKKFKEEETTSDTKQEEASYNSIITDLKVSNVSTDFLSILAKHFEFSQAAFYTTQTMPNDLRILKYTLGYAHFITDGEELSFKFGQGICGQAAKSQKKILIKNVEEGQTKITSGLGSASPNNLLVIPFMKENETIAVLEIASFKTIDEVEVNVIEKLVYEHLTDLTQDAHNV